MTVLRPLSGHADTVRALAVRLHRQGELLLSLAETVRGLAGAEVSWHGPAAAAFATRARPAATLLVAVGRRHAVSAVALRGFADSLDSAQRVAEAAAAEHEVALPRAIALGTARVEAEACADPAQRAAAAGLHHREVVELERAQGAERRHTAAWRAFEDADRRCAAVLRALLEDGLSDSRAYDTLTGLSRAAGGIESAAGAVGLIPAPPAKALGAVAGAAGAVTVLADATVRVAYGDGDWGSIGLAAAAASTGGAAKVLKRGALATNPAAAAAATRGERRLRRLRVADRLKLGVSGELRRAPREGGPRRELVAGPRRGSGSPAASARWLAEQARARAEHAVRVRWLDDLAVATRDPARSRTMLVTGWGVEGSATVLGGGAAWREHRLERQQSAADDRRDQRLVGDRDGAGERRSARPR
ncbi:hypothetical protein SAMN04489867_0609 [Pedococcus dokdonensis]|uniref:Uncharacterized protein n=1 Tax=Pedococcus dokdonensis TaxID=443156 RepID=A0A1H0MGU8_9MICO|nr:hypothetical protein [Pedococcus dokdonensis]SDO79659.1 hypothetical protein SAMN04489867_0609 [Pedococcus dokdonensis]